MRGLSILGSTGSIGTTTLALVDRFPERFRVVALAAGKNVERLAAQIAQYRPEVVSVGDEESARALQQQLGASAPAIEIGSEGLRAAATAPGADLVIAGVVGAVGLAPTLAALEAGKTVALANKEALVVAGELMTATARRHGATLLPIDSEHNAVFQALRGHRAEDVRRILLTASGGPFLDASREDLERATVESALEHPTWKMGAKITIDSATLMNKGLEVIEARWLFDVPPEKIGVVVHPQSIVHSLVEYVDGSFLAQMGIADMSIPISYAMAWPGRLPLDDLPRLDLPAIGQLTFREPDLERFPCLALAWRALEEGGTMPATLNAANEIAVAAFLDGRIPFLAIPAILERVMAAQAARPADDLETVLGADRAAREAAERLAAEAA